MALKSICVRTHYKSIFSTVKSIIESTISITTYSKLGDDFWRIWRSIIMHRDVISARDVQQPNELKEIAPCQNCVNKTGQNCSRVEVGYRQVVARAKSDGCAIQQ